MSSDKISGLRKPLVQLKLDTVAGGNLKENVVEMDIKELKMLLNSLKSAQAVRTSMMYFVCFYSLSIRRHKSCECIVVKEKN